MPPSDNLASPSSLEEVSLSSSRINDMVVAGIEVEALDLNPGRKGSMTTRISLIAGSPTSVVDGASGRRTFGGRAKGRGWADCGISGSESFDSADVIPENSNEAKLLKRVAAGAMFDFSEGGDDDPYMDNSLRSTGGSFDETEAEYRGVLDRHMQESKHQVDNFAQMDHISVYRHQGDAQQQQHQQHQQQKQMQHQLQQMQGRQVAQRPGRAATIEDFMEQVITYPCCECTTSFEPHSSLKSVLRPQKRGLRTPTGDTVLITNPQTISGVPPQVQFKDVEVLEFPMTLGIHPSATTGPPVMIDWSSGPSQNRSTTFEEYETTRAPRRTRRQLKLSLRERHAILVKEAGFSFEEVKNAWQEALTIRKQRRETLERGLALMKVDEVWESTCRKFNRAVDFTFG